MKLTFICTIMKYSLEIYAQDVQCGRNADDPHLSTWLSSVSKINHQCLYENIQISEQFSNQKTWPQKF